ncbi:unnamed protein product [Paramecium sonneborni]|uniref:Uncharacterized protein n=1 Tax=Paramecium sonneborni TaxID=65129 RepID=A0A8S1RRF5_9CILI|nr:unnamed protein product [Paramecium sonneborni]
MHITLKLALIASIIWDFVTIITLFKILDNLITTLWIIQILKFIEFPSIYKNQSFKKSNLIQLTTLIGLKINIDLKSQFIKLPFIIIQIIKIITNFAFQRAFFNIKFKVFIPHQISNNNIKTTKSEITICRKAVLLFYGYKIVITSQYQPKRVGPFTFTNVALLYNLFKIKKSSIYIYKLPELQLLLLNNQKIVQLYETFPYG